MTTERSAQQSRDFYELECIVDRASLADVLSWLAQICNDKAEHIECSWQPDDKDAELWIEASNQLEELSSNCPI